MKAAFIILLVGICTGVFCQAKKQAGRVNKNKITPNSTLLMSSGSDTVAPRQTATERYLNGPVRNGVAAGAAKSTTGDTTFVGGIQAANNATKTFDTVPANRNTANTVNTVNTVNTANTANSETTNTTIRGGNDTTFNINTISQGGVTTNSGAVDRSGQAQFGQTNWGSSRSTVGESQWTIPPPITASFNKEFPASNGATWTRNNIDTTIYSARYKSGAQWVTTNYNTSGERLDVRTEFPLVQPPRPVSVYIAKQPSTFQAVTIYKLQMQGKPDVYEIRSRTGKTIYVNNYGMEVNY